jgi:plastocyanin
MRRLCLIATIGVLALAGCGGDDEEEPASGGSSGGSSSESSGSSSGGGEQLAISADASALKFDKETLTAPAGTVTITMANPSSSPHNVVIDGGSNNKPGEIVGKGEDSVASADLEAGEYAYYCAVGSHRDAGMEGTLTVE